MSLANLSADDRSGFTLRRTIPLQRLLNVLFAIFIASGAIAFVEPSPYDVMALMVIPLWFVAGFRVHRLFVPFCALISLYVLGGFISLVPYWHDTAAVMFMLSSLYLMITALFFALFFAERTSERAELCLKAFTFANIVAASSGVAGYFNIAGAQDFFTLYGRASGTFKDPNVLGGFLILGSLYCMQLLMLNRTRWRHFTMAVLLLLLAGVFLTLSRGSWGALLFSAIMMVALTFLTTKHAGLRVKIIIGFLFFVALAAVLLLVMLSFDSIWAQVQERSSGGYEDRRYFNQLRSLPFLLENPLGYGPLRFRLTYDIEPHSSYVNAFASYGWFGGFAFLLLVITTVWVGIRLCIKTSPYRLYAHLFVPTLFSFLVQGFQIDIDHWRHVYFLLGAVWGLEAARQRWLMAQAREAGNGGPTPG